MKDEKKSVNLPLKGKVRFSSEIDKEMERREI